LGQTELNNFPVVVIEFKELEKEFFCVETILSNAATFEVGFLNGATTNSQTTFINSDTQKNH
jgi:hypothetical protein